MEVLRTTALTKRYRTVTALAGLDLSVSAGTVYGLLGPNGSGKTTTLGILLGVIRSSGGSYSWFGGRHGDNPRNRIGALLETPNFYPYLDAVENLKIIAHIKKVKTPPIAELLQQVDLFDRRHSRFRTFSLGMKQRLAIAAALVGDPDVLIFDEPANGLDPQGIAEIRETLQRIAAHEKTIIMASHLLDEVEKICTHVGILQDGRLLASGPVGNILSDDPVIEVDAEELAALRALFENLPEVTEVEASEHGLTLSGKTGLTPELLNRTAFQNGIVLRRLQSRKKSLEAEFLEVTRKTGI